MKTLAVPSESDQEFLAIRVRLLARSAIRLPAVLLLISCIVCFALRAQVPRATLLLWLGLSMAAVLPRALYAWWLLYQRQGPIAPRRDYNVFILFAAMSGAGSGMSAPMFFPFLQPPQQAFIGMVLAGLVAGGVATSGSSPLVLAAYAVSAMLPLGVAWSVYGHDELHLVTWLVLLFSSVMLFYARDGKRVLFESFVIRRQRDEAYARLEQKNQEVMTVSAKAEALAETKSRVLAAASHDLRQPLHALSIYSAVLATNPNRNTMQEVAQNIDQTVRSLGALLDALLDLSQIDSNSFPLHVRPVCLGAVVHQVCAEFEYAAMDKGLSLEVNVVPTTVLSDPMVLERIVRNLLDNAIKYTQQGGISVALERKDSTAELCIRDTGKGIAAEQVEQVFEEFYQVDNPGRDRRRGLGLGLSIVQRMVNLLGAKLELESTLGKGSCFRLLLPIAKRGAMEPTCADLTNLCLSGKRILLIDDEALIIASMSTLLQAWGAQPLAASSFATAEQYCAALDKPDLIIVDLRLADGENGVVWLARLRERYGQIPALVITGETVAERMAMATAANLPILQKPVSPERLFDAIAGQLFDIED